MRRGFTLVEIAIVLVVIGLLVGGLLIGRSMIEASRSQAQIRQVIQIDIALRNFSTKYGGIPGDSSLFYSSGNNNGLVEDANGTEGLGAEFSGEVANYWVSLEQAESFRISDIGVPEKQTTQFAALENKDLPNLETAAAPLFTATITGHMTTKGNQINVPPSKLGAGEAGIIVTNDTTATSSGTSFRDAGIGGSYLIGDVSTVTAADKAITPDKLGDALTPADLLALDAKVDDGLPNTGIVIATSKSGNCVSSAKYNTSYTSPACQMVVGYKRVSGEAAEAGGGGGGGGGGGDVCGDGSITGAEACDDSNTANGDGCDSSCQIEAGPDVCGDGSMTGAEQCDDSNTSNNDGCSSSCLIESCGDSIVNGAETCDDGNNSGGDGCDASCQTEADPCAGITCGNGTTGVCSAGSCTCSDPNGPYGPYSGVYICCANGYSDDGSGNCVADPVCGNGVIESGETCDDGNQGSGDGCDSSCQTEAPAAVCGNSILEDTEGCDDGNQTGGDGCNDNCTIGPTCNTSICEMWNGSACVYACIGQQGCFGGPSCVDPICSNATCEVLVNGSCVNNCGAGTSCNGMGSCVADCGDGDIDPGEACDDGGTSNGDGCDSSCQTEAPADVCGDGSITGAEQCDDGGTANGDGCDSSCQTEAGDVCGDGAITGAEQCDDSNTTGGDGCNADCTNGPTCDSNMCESWNGSSCAVTCIGQQSCNMGGCQDPVCNSNNCEAAISGTCQVSCGAGTTCDGSGTCVTDPYCGDGSCNGSDSTANCPSDCGSACGDGVCNGGEGCGDCSGDCGFCPYCGDGSCNNGETCDDGMGGGCSDCGSC